MNSPGAPIGDENLWMRAFRHYLAARNELAAALQFYVIVSTAGVSNLAVAAANIQVAELKLAVMRNEVRRVERFD